MGKEKHIGGALWCVTGDDGSHLHLIRPSLGEILDGLVAQTKRRRKGNTKGFAKSRAGSSPASPIQSCKEIMPDASIKADVEDEEALAVHYGAKAWAAIKPAGDPEWNALPMEIRHKLIDLAKRYLTGHAEKQGDYAPAGFRDAVIGLVISDEVNIVAPEGAQGLNALLTDGRVLVGRERVDVA